MKERWNVELAEWRGRRLDELEVVYVWVDGVYVKAGFEREKSAVLVVIGGREWGHGPLHICARWHGPGHGHEDIQSGLDLG